jgi:hypothetical protein
MEKRLHILLILCDCVLSSDQSSRSRGRNTLVYAFTSVPEGTEADYDLEQRRQEAPAQHSSSSVASEPGYYDDENVWRSGLPTRQFVFRLPGNRRAYANVSVSRFFARGGSRASSSEVTQQRLGSSSIRAQTLTSEACQGMLNSSTLYAVILGHTGDYSALGLSLSLRAIPKQPLSWGLTGG